jgi:hypothetical protein
MKGTDISTASFSDFKNKSRRIKKSLKVIFDLLDERKTEPVERTAKRGVTKEKRKQQNCVPLSSSFVRDKKNIHSK